MHLNLLYTSNVGTPHIVPTPVRHRNPNQGLHHRQEPNNSQQNNCPKLSPWWAAAKNVYPDLPPQLAAPNRGLHPSREINNSQQKKKKKKNPNLSHVGTQRIMSTQIRARNLLRQFGVYTPRGKPTIFSKTSYQILSPCWDAMNNVSLDRTPNLAAPNRGLHHPPGKK